MSLKRCGLIVLFLPCAAWYAVYGMHIGFLEAMTCLREDVRQEWYYKERR